MKSKVEAGTGGSRIGRQLHRFALAAAAFAVASCVVAVPKVHARVWLMAAGSAVGARGFAAAPQARHLADLTPTMREIAHLPRDTDRSAGTPMLELLGAGPR